jgi:hypothetical protein
VTRAQFSQDEGASTKVGRTGVGRKTNRPFHAIAANLEVGLDSLSVLLQKRRHVLKNDERRLQRVDESERRSVGRAALLAVEA